MKLSEIISFIQYGDLPTSYFKKKGMIIGKNFNRQSGVRMDPSHCWLIQIGDDVTLANKVQILAHDDSSRIYTGYSRIGEVHIGDRVFIGANSTILMHTHIGNDVIIGAGSLVTTDIPDGCIAYGVPARVVGRTEDFVKRIKTEIKEGITFDKSFSYYNGVGKDKKNIMRDKLSCLKSICFLEIGKYED